VVLFQDYEDERELWQEERTVVFSRTDTNAPFVFDPVASTISAAFKAKVFATDSMDRNDFVEFAYDRLLRIARDAADPAGIGCVVFSARLKSPEGERSGSPS